VGQFAGRRCRGLGLESTAHAAGRIPSRRSDSHSKAQAGDRRPGHGSPPHRAGVRGGDPGPGRVARWCKFETDPLPVFRPRCELAELWQNAASLHPERRLTHLGLPSKNSERELTGRVTFVGRHCEDSLGDMSDRCVLIETFCVVQLRRHVLEQGQ